MTPPTQIGSVVDKGKYAPTAKESDFTPHSSMVMDKKAPTNTNCQSRLKLNKPLIKVAIKVPCGAGYLSLPMACWMPWETCSGEGVSRICKVAPMAIEETIAPTKRAICWYFGVAPMIYPVFRSCEVAPALAAAIQIILPTTKTIGSKVLPVIPKPIKIRAVPIKVAMVIPETGLELVPIKPTIRLETVTKKNPKTITSRPISNFPPKELPGICGKISIRITSARLPIPTTAIDKSCSVRARLADAERFLKDSMLSLNEAAMVGMVLSKVIKPPAATAPAPI